MADIKQIKIGNTLHNIEPYTDYLPLAGGTMTGAGAIQFPVDNSASKRTHYISAGSGYSANSGKYGVKLLVCDQSDCQSGLGQDCATYSTAGAASLPYDLWVVGGKNPSSAQGYISFGFHTKDDIDYKRVAYYDYAGNLFINGELHEDGKALSTKYATKEYVTGIIDGAPEALDTLNKLAAALGDNENFAAVVTNTLTSLDSSIKGEVTRATAAENALSGRITANTNNITSNNEAITQNAANIQTNKTAIATEKARAEGVESGLDTRVTTNATNISTLQGYFTSGKANQTKGTLTVKADGTGAENVTFDGSANKTISYNSVGAVGVANTEIISGAKTFSNAINAAGVNSTGGRDITLKASTAGISADAGDVVYADKDGKELGRIWMNGKTLSHRWSQDTAGSPGSAYPIVLQGTATGGYVPKFNSTYTKIIENG